MKILPNGSIKLDGIDEELLLSMKDGPKGRKELVLLAPTKRIGQRRIETFLKYELIQRPRQGVYGLTSKGKNYIKKLTPTVAVTLNDPKLQVLIDLLPTEAHRALFRLILSGIVAKFHYFQIFQNNWPAFIMGGLTGALKTGLANIICQVVKQLDPTRNIYPLYTAVAGEFGVRRTRSRGGFDISSSPYFKEPFMCFDEFNCIPNADVKRKVLFFLDGRTEFSVEGGKKITNHCVPFVTLNTSPRSFGIDEPYIRRSVVVNTEYVRHQLKNIRRIARKIDRFLSTQKAPRIDLKALLPRGKRLSEDEFGFLDDLFMENVAEDYKDYLVDTPPLEPLVLGRLTLLGSRDSKEAIFQIVWDRLECLETMEGAKDDWRKRINNSWLQYRSIEQPQVLARIKEAEEEGRERKEKIEKTKEQVISQKVEKEVESVSLVGYKETVKSKFKELKNPLPDPKKRRWQTRISPFYKMLSKALDQINGKRTTQEISTYEKKVYLKLKHKRDTLLEEIKEIEEKERKSREEEKTKQNTFKEKKAILKKGIKDYEKLLILRLKKLGAGTEHIQEAKEIFIGLASETTNAKDIESLDSIKLRFEETKKTFNDEISSLEERQQEKRREEEEKRREQEKNKKLKVIQNKKNEILEKSRMDVFQSKYLTSQQKAQLDILQNYQKRKKAPVSDITSFLKERKLIFKMNIFYRLANGQTVLNAFNNSYYKRFGELLPYEVYWAVDGQVYPLNYFNTWDKALILIQIRIDQIKKIAIQKRKNKLAEEWNRLNKPKQNLKPHF